uniref:RelA/SpoT domain protein n=1 Tax=Geobacter sp. (strain M21) TaxID=443144 RepID=C6E4I1_GEOSM
MSSSFGNTKLNDKKYSGKQVIRAGEMLLNDAVFENGAEFESAMDVLSYWRFTHEMPLEEAFKVIQDIALQVDKTAIFAKRLKRYVSIVNKLRRFREMKLKNMQDIGGCRAISSNTKKIYQIVRQLKKRPEFRDTQGKIRFKDYIDKPKDDGYRGYHLIGHFKAKHGVQRSIEVQLRTVLQHDWATALEIVDLFTGQALKSNLGDLDWKRFFKGVSEQFAAMESIHLFTLKDISKRQEYLKAIKESKELLKSCDDTQRLGKKLAVENRFQAFANSLKIIDQHLGVNSVKGYVLIEVDTIKTTVTVNFFSESDSKVASQKYTEAEKKSAGKDSIVVALVSTTAVGGIKEAYPNYFADSTEFIKHYMLIATVPISTGFMSSFFS